MKNVLLISEGESAPREIVGGKAAGLCRLRSLDLPVPRFVVLTAEAYRRASTGGPAPRGLPEEIAEEIKKAWHALGAGSPPLAVRSSAIEEDAVGRSFAGQMETFLNVTTLESLSEAVLGCWRSLHSERVAVYRGAGGKKGEPATPPAMAVVIQEMLDPEASGVLFTVNPVNGRADELLASSVWGLGEGLVSGTLDADTYVLDRSGRVLSRKIAEKRERIDRAPGGGTKRTPVASGQVHAPSLDDRLLAKLVRAALQAAGDAKCPQDIEFSVQKGRLFLLQARPVTGFTERPRLDASPRWVWDNSNINESYPGITLPLTYSFIREAYHAVYWQFCEVLWLSPAEIRRLDPMLWNMLGLIRGRVYYNLIHWYRLVSLLPGFKFNKSFMEHMMGLRQPEELTLEGTSWIRRYGVELPRLLRTGYRAYRLHQTLSRDVQAFHRDFAGVYGEYSRVDFETLEPADAWAAYVDLKSRILWRWKAPIINDFEAMIFYGVLKKLTVSWEVDSEGSIQNALLSGQGDIESTEVSDRLVALAGRMAGEAAFSDAFRAASLEEAQRMLLDHPQFGPAFRQYIERYGDRAAEELKLESKTMKDDPGLCIAMIQNHLRTGVPRTARAGGKGGDARALALRILDQKLTGRCFGGLVPRRTAYLWVAERAKEAVRNRENQRLERTRAFSLVRQIFRSIGRAFARRGMMGEPEDVFYLTLPEIEAAIRPGAPPSDLRPAVQKRRKEYEEYRNEPPLPDHFKTIGHPETGPYEIQAEAGAPEDPGLKGLGACPGVVQARAAVLEKPDRTVRLDGDILVARQTDPGWVVLFPSISGLIVERGSMLSHSAIVAREMGIPAVVGVRGAMAAIQTGDLVKLDGAKGTIEILKKGKA